MGKLTEAARAAEERAEVSADLIARAEREAAAKKVAAAEAAEAALRAELDGARAAGAEVRMELKSTVRPAIAQQSAAEPGEWSLSRPLSRYGLG